VEDVEDTKTYRVVVNGEDQYSIWLADRDLPNGWSDAGKVGSRAECLAFVAETWTDMRPRTVREQLKNEQREK
jgi:MbtH protein